ncbi:MAG: ABC transporter substrate-binding protein [Clostridia bacterium]|nr:ABC transporter substrate-binding protein [Clostridia bacterium]
MHSLFVSGRKHALAAFVLIAIIALTGCSNRDVSEQPSESGGLIIGFAQLGSESAWRLGNTQSIIEAAERAGVQLMFENAQQKQENQIRDIRSFIAYRVDVIAFAPIVEDGWDNVLGEARDAGIPVLVTDRMINTQDDTLFAGFIGSDFYEEGVMAGEYLIKKADAIDAESLNIVEISGTVESTPMKQRAQGFADTIKGDARLDIIDSVSGDFIRSKGKECMQKFIDTHDKIDVLYSHNDAMTLGAIEAMEEAGLKPGEDIIIITVDGEQKAIDLLKEGKINCVVECTPLIGDTIMQIAAQLARGEEIPRYTYSEDRVFSEFDDDLDELPERGY